MVEVSPVALFLLGEAVVVLTLIVVVGALLAGRRRHRDKRAIRTLIAEAGSEAESRRARLDELLSSGYGFEGETLEEHLQAILGAERRFLQNFIRLYRRRDPVAASRIRAAVAELVAPYHRLGTPAASADSPERGGGEDPEPEAARIGELEAQNVQLVQELEIIRETLDRMLRVYGAALGDDGPDPGRQGSGRAAATAADDDAADADSISQLDDIEVASDVEGEPRRASG